MMMVMMMMVVIIIILKEKLPDLARHYASHTHKMMLTMLFSDLRRIIIEIKMLSVYRHTTAFF